LQVEAGLKVIQRNPKIHPISYKRTRIHLIKRFPFKLIYIFEEEDIIILAVIHSKRSPDLLTKRMNSIEDIS